MLKTIQFCFLVITIFIVACSPKATAPIVEVPEIEEPSNIECPQFSNLSSADRETAENAFVLYKDYLGMEKNDVALPFWRQAFNLAPGSNGRVKSHFDDGVTLYADLIKKSGNKQMQQKYMDTIEMIYAKREICFDVDASYYGQKAFDYYYKLYDYIDEETIYNTFKKSIEVGNGKIEYFIINPFTKLLYDKVYDKTVSNKEASKYATMLNQTIKEGVANCVGKKCESWAIINDYAPDLLSSFEGVDSFYDCTYYTNKYFTAFEQYPEDCDVINKALAKMLRGGCDPNDDNIVAVKAAKTDKCYTPPPPPGLLRQGYDAYSSGDYNSAVNFFEQYAKENDDVDKKSKYLLLIAKIYYADIKNYPKSRTYARKAAEVKSSWGDPYILIGKLYASSGPLCGPGRGWDSQIVTWPAIDMFQYAKKIDPNVSSEANKWINIYRQYMPNKEDIFQRSIEAGSSYRVGCWIQENTIVRTAD